MALNKKLATRISIMTLMAAIGAHNAQAAVLTPSTGTNTITDATNTWNINGNLGATGANIVYDGGGAVQVTVTDGTGGGSANLGSFTVTSVAGANSLIVGDGAKTMTLTINGAVSGDVASNDLTISVDADDAAAGSSTLNFLSDVNVGSTGTGITLNDDDDGVATVGFLGGSAQAITGKIDGSNDGEGTILVTDADESAAPTTDTFNSTIGGSKYVGYLQVGSASKGGAAVFAQNVSVFYLDVIGGDHANEDSQATFQADLTVAGDVILTENSGTSTLNVTGSGAQLIDAFITGEVEGEGALVITDSDASSAADIDVFVQGIGGSDYALKSLSIGSSTLAGAASFNGDVAAQTITITGGDNDAEDNFGSFQGDVTASTGITLDNNTGSATININGAAAQTIAGTIDGGANSEGKITVTDADGDAAPTEDTFEDIIGGTARLGNIEVGSQVYQQAGAAVFSSEVYTDYLDILGGDHADEDSHASFVSDLTIFGDAILWDDGGTATLKITGADAQTITASRIIGAGEGQGAIVVTDATSDTLADEDVFTGTIGTEDYVLDSISIGSSTLGGAASFAGDVFAQTVRVTGGDNSVEDNYGSFEGDVTASTGIILDDNTGSATINFNGSTLQAVTGSINAASSGEGHVVFSNDTVVTGNLGATRLATIQLDAGKSLTLGTADSITLLGATAANMEGDVTVKDTIRLASGTTLTFVDGSSISFTQTYLDNIGTGAAFDAKTNGATFVVGEAAGDEVTLTLPTTFRAGSFILANAANAGTLTMNGSFAIADNGITQYNVSTTDDIVVITAGVDTSLVMSNLGVSAGSAAGLSAGLEAARLLNDDELTDAYNEALEAGGLEAQKAAEQSANPAAALSASSHVAANAGIVAINPIASHLEGQRANSSMYSQATSGISSGAIQNGSYSVWAKPFYNNLAQEETDNIAGYHAETSGLVMGTDLYQDAETTIGVAFSYGKTNVDGEGLGRDSTDIDSYQVVAYGGYTADAWYIDGYLGYGQNQSSTERHIDFGGLNKTAKGEYSGRQYTLKVDGGVPIEVSQDVFFTPLAGIQYVHVTNDSYAETGAGSSNIYVNPTDLDVMKGSIGAKLHTTVNTGRGKLVPQVHANLLYDAMGDEAQSTSTYSGGGSSFIIEGNKVEQLGGNVGAGLTYEMDMMSVSVGYDAEIKSDYLSHTASAELRFRF